MIVNQYIINGEKINRVLIVKKVYEMLELLIKSESVSSNSLGQLKVAGHDGDSLGVDGAEVGVLEEGDQVCLGSLLEGQDGGGLESEFLLPLVGDFPDHSLEGQLADEEVSGLLVLPDFPEGHCSGFEPVGLLDSGGHWGGLPGDLLGHQLLPWHLLGGGFSGCLFCSGHLC